MNAESLQSGRFFDDFANTFDSFYDGKRSSLMQWIDKRFRSDIFIRYALTFERLGDLKNRRGLDIGCGSGPYLAEALRRGAAHMVALDPAPRMLELTRQRALRLGKADRVSFLEGYFPQTRPAGFFDFAVVMGVMDYVADSFGFLRALRGSLAGPAAISFPRRHWLRTPLRRVRYRLRRCPLYFYDEASIRSLASRAGFATVDIVEIEGAGMDYHVCLRP